MKLKFTFFLLIFSISLFKVMAQSDALKAQSAYLNAEEAYQQSKFTESVDFLNSAKTLLGKTNGKIQYLLVKSLKNANRFDDAKKELATYFDVTPEDTQDEKYREMVQNIALLDKLKVQNEELLKTKEKERQLAIVQAEKTKLQQEQGRLLQLEVAKTIENDMVLVEGGKYYNDIVSLDFHTRTGNYTTSAKRVEISDFYCSKFEISQKIWDAYMGNNPSQNSGCMDCPVENVSWEEVQYFINKLNIISEKKYRLLTEMEWEYVIKEASSTLPNIRKSINEFAWYGNNTQKIGTKNPNKLGIFDIFGNVAEFCIDSYDKKYNFTKSLDNPVNLNESGEKVVRGTSYLYSSNIDKAWDFSYISLYRLGVKISHKSSAIGFRICRSK